MRLDLDGGFDRRAVAWSMRLYGAALLAELGYTAWAGAWAVHAGRLFPWRHVNALPFYGTFGLALEWLVTALVGVALIAQKRTAIALRVAVVVTFVTLVQRFSNHGVLFFLTAIFYAMAPPDLAAESFEREEHPSLGLLRWQLVIVYWTSVLNKLLHGFLSGGSLENLLGFPHAISVALSFGAVGAEVAIPVLLYFRPRVGIAAAFAMHLGFAIFMSGIISFGFGMLALAVLFVRPLQKS